MNEDPLRLSLLGKLLWQVQRGLTRLLVPVHEHEGVVLAHELLAHQLEAVRLHRRAL